jgi:hypothetical protein
MLRHGRHRGQKSLLLVKGTPLTASEPTKDVSVSMPAPNNNTGQMDVTSIKTKTKGTTLRSRLFVSRLYSTLIPICVAVSLDFSRIVFFPLTIIYCSPTMWDKKSSVCSTG